MSLIKGSKYLLFILFSFFAINSASGQLIVDAGPDKTICPGDTAHIGGFPTVSGGKGPYIYFWSPSAGLNSVNVSNPIASPGESTTYTLTVSDDTGAVQTSSVIVSMSSVFYVNAGRDTSICTDGSALIGGDNNVTWAGINYSWSPSLGLNDTTLARPVANPLQTTTYTLTATIAGCPPKTDFTVITFIPPPPIDAGADITIQEGENITLHVTGANYYWWWSPNSLTYYSTADPDAEPLENTTYYVMGSDPTGKCSAMDSVKVIVEPKNDVVFYNTFTPNGDGNNDTWYIGNVNKYPNNRLEIYSRNGKLIYKKIGYLNSWDGTAFGTLLPAATYFYMMDLGGNAGKFHGTVTIVR